MKRLLFLLTVALLNLTASADQSGTCGNSVKWYFSSSTGTMTISGSGEMNDYQYNTTPWYNIRSSIKQVVVNSGVTRVGNYAFYNCNYLTTLSLPEGLKSLGHQAFDFCYELTAVNIPKSVETFGSTCFQGCRSLSSIVVNSGNTKYDSRNNCNAIIETSKNMLIAGCKNTVIPNDILTIGNLAFSDMSGLQSITIPSSVTNIQLGAFRGCSGLTSVQVADGNPVYDSRNGCNAIIETATNTLITGCKTTVIPNSVTNIGNYAFYRSSMTSVTIPNSVTAIGAYAFYNAELTSVTFPNSLKSIGSSAFQYCYNLATFNIPESITDIQLDAFTNTKWYNSQSNGLLYQSNWLLGYKGNKPTGKCTIAEGTKRIANYAFRDCTSLTSVTIPNSVVFIGNSAFWNCSGLTTIPMGNNVTTIGAWAFYGCSALSSITLGDKVEQIGTGAFASCTSLTSIVFPKSVTSIGGSIFGLCNKLQDVYCHAATIPATDLYAFNNSNISTATLHVPASSLLLYQSIAPWNQFGTIVALPETKDYNWSIGPNGDFADINAAMNDDRVKDGDVLHVLDGTALTEEQTVSKSVTITGTGYAKKDGIRPVHIANLSIEAEATKLKGLGLGTVIVREENAVIEHCYVSNSIYDDDNYYSDGLTVRSSLLLGSVSLENGDDVTFQNNILISSAKVCYAAAVLDHNLISTLGMGWEEMTMQNNIIILSDIDTDGKSTINNNVFSIKALSGYPDNKYENTNLNTVFTCNGNPDDEVYWQLAEGSPAKGYATDGGDCGPWSGDEPYVIGGIYIPVPLSGTATLDVNKADNQAAGIYQTLLSLFTTIGSNGLAGDLNVNVAAGTYYFTISDATFPILQALAVQLATGTGQLSMQSANGGTIFNFQIDQTFLTQHVSDLATILTQVQATLQQITLAGIKVYLNGNMIINEDFQVEPNDLLALKNMYQAWGGDSWTTKQWSFETNGRRKEDFPGVTFNEEGRVTAIDLENNGLAGSTFDITPVQLTEVTSLNLSRNQLTGDVSQIVQNMTKLNTLNLSYNRLTLLSEPSAIASTCTSPNLRFQNRVWTQGTEANLPFAFADLEPITIPMQRTALSLSFPSLFNYEYEKLIYLKDINTPATTYAEIYSYSDLTPNTQYRIYRLAQDFPVALVFGYGAYRIFESAYPAILHYAVGDADMTGETNVLDVQYTLNYILAPSTITYFNYSAANTYADEQINVQDIVATVNILLGQPSSSRTANAGASPVSARTDANTADGEIYTSGDRLLIRSTKAVAALDIELQGVTTDEVSLLLNRRDFQMIGRDTEGGSRFVIFSLTGKHLPADEATAILRMTTEGEPVAIACADAEAQPVMLAIASATTGITHTTHRTDHPVYDLQGRKADGHTNKGVYIRNGKKIVVR